MKMMHQQALAILEQAITLHKKHMTGEEPATPASQEKLMRMLKQAQAVLTDHPMSEMMQRSAKMR